jgi:hypothetical protein
MVKFTLYIISRPLNSDIVAGIMIYRVSSMYTHDQKILRILIAAFATELLSVPIIQLVGWLGGLNVNTAGEFFTM